MRSRPPLTMNRLLHYDHYIDHLGLKDKLPIFIINAHTAFKTLSVQDYYRRYYSCTYQVICSK